MKRAREVVEGAPVQAFGYDFIDDDYFDGADIQDGYSIDQCEGCVCVPDLERLVDSLDRYRKFEDKQEALDAIDEAPERATHYRKLSCGTRYIKQGPRFFEYWNGSEWCRPTVPFTDETHILRFDKLDDLKQSIKDHESIYGGGDA
ncbi:hypothetical protein [Acinetobacter baumannii]|uniref:hypothetical protein n=1 Tax=Acinetobacter baumannii TaxID=470 RepID=UPI00140FBAD8|nr:hypothetical protein [Acinetobacter baumannii]NHR89705.1 hypothetical protein [Acinetobacter baumannii]HBM1182770.1 hypothetical protein [Acinetobacter baumannii]HCA3178897.1 hypothetical protein [Acinetobacter baumannii]